MAGARVKLHRGLYSEQAIADAAETFADFATCAVRVDGEHYLVELTDIATEVDGDVVAEFCNFALANTAVQRKNSHA
jgi:hypothetical protein